MTDYERGKTNALEVVLESIMCDYCDIKDRCHGNSDCVELWSARVDEVTGGE